MTRIGSAHTGSLARAGQPWRSRWTPWARALRRRWTSRRHARAALEFVWLRRLRVRGAEGGPIATVHPVTIRLAINATFLCGWQASPAREAARGGAVQSSSHDLARHEAAFATSGPRPLLELPVSRRRARTPFVPVAMPARSRLHAEVGHADATTWPERALGMTERATPTRSTRPPGLGPPLVDLVIRRTPRVTTDAIGGTQGPNPRQARRVETGPMAPPPIVVRTHRREPVNPAMAATPARRDPAFDARGGWETEMRFGWATESPGARGPAVTPAMMASLTDQVMRQMNDRVRAKRERMGKV